MYNVQCTMYNVQCSPIAPIQVLSIRTTGISFEIAFYNASHTCSSLALSEIYLNSICLHYCWLIAPHLTSKHEIDGHLEVHSKAETIYLSIYPIVLGTFGAPHDLATNSRHSSRSSAFLTASLSSKPVQSRMLSSHHFLCRPLLRLYAIKREARFLRCLRSTFREGF